MRLICSVCMILFWGPIPVSAADAGFSSLIESVMSLDFPKIRVMMRVYTPDATELSFDAFKLSERQSLISTFTVELVRKEPYVALLLDRSSSMEPVVGTVKESAAAFVKGMSGPSRVSLITFASDVDLVTGFIREQEQLLAGIGKMRPWGGTALFDALYQACEQLRSAAGTDDRKTIVLLTDGRDEVRRANPASTHKADGSSSTPGRTTSASSASRGTNIDETFLKRIAGKRRPAQLHRPTARGHFPGDQRRMMLERRYKINMRPFSRTRRHAAVGRRGELKARKIRAPALTSPHDPVKAEAEKPHTEAPLPASRSGTAAPFPRIRWAARRSGMMRISAGSKRPIRTSRRSRRAAAARHWTDLATDAMPVGRNTNRSRFPGRLGQEKPTSPK